MSDKLSRRTSIKIWSKLRFFPLCSQFWIRKDPFLSLTVTYCSLCSRQIIDKNIFPEKMNYGLLQIFGWKGSDLLHNIHWKMNSIRFFFLTRKLRQLNWIQIKQVVYWKIKLPFYIRFNIEEAKILENSVTHESWAMTSVSTACNEFILKFMR